MFVLMNAWTFVILFIYIICDLSTCNPRPHIIMLEIVHRKGTATGSSNRTFGFSSQPNG